MFKGVKKFKESKEFYKIDIILYNYTVMNNNIFITEDIFISQILYKLNLKKINNIYTLYNLILTNKYFKSIIDVHEIWFMFYKQFNPDKYKLTYDKNNNIISKHICNDDINYINHLEYEYIINNTIQYGTDTYNYLIKNRHIGCFYKMYHNENNKIYKKNMWSETASYWSEYKKWAHNNYKCLCIDHYDPTTLTFAPTKNQINIKRKCIVQINKYYNIKLKEILNKINHIKRDTLIKYEIKIRSLLRRKNEYISDIKYTDINKHYNIKHKNKITKLNNILSHYQLEYYIHLERYNINHTIYNIYKNIVKFTSKYIDLTKIKYNKITRCKIIPM